MTEKATDSLSSPGHLLSELRFPSAFTGQQLFTKGDDWHNNAMLGWTHFAWDIYASGYKDAADALVAAIAERRTSLDSAIYPLVFLYRQALELELKLLLPLARHLAGEESIADHHHRLLPLWQELRRLLWQLNPREDDKEMPAIEEFIRQMDKVDPGSYAFRYPTNKKGEVSLPDLRHINVRHLSEIMDSVFMMLGGIYAWLDDGVQNSIQY